MAGYEPLPGRGRVPGSPPVSRRRRVARWTESGLMAVALVVLVTGIVATMSPRLAPADRPAAKIRFGEQAGPHASSFEGRVAPAPSPRETAVRTQPVADVVRSADTDDTSPAAAAPRHCPAPPAVPTGTSIGAWTKLSRLPVYRTPGASTPMRSLKNPTRDGMTLVMLVRRIQGEWALVQISERPNGTTAWVRRSQVIEYPVDHHIVVELCARRMTLYDAAGRVVMRETVATGSARYPTPTGRFFIDYQYKEPNPRGSYGPWLLSIAGFSNVLKTFAGGIGQIAFHGTNRPASVGRPVSHGCLRMHNSAVTRLQKYALPGTPVDIYA